VAGLLVRPNRERVLVASGAGRVLGALARAMGEGMTVPRPLAETLAYYAGRIGCVEIGLPEGKGDGGFVHCSWRRGRVDEGAYLALRRVGFVRQTRARELTCFVGRDLRGLVDLDRR
jgi:hypothetical protein